MEEALHPGRYLFNASYIDGGCEGDPPADSDKDNTVGTWSTNYLMASVAVAGAVLLYLQLRGSRGGAAEIAKRPVLAAAYQRRAAMITFCIPFAIGIAIAGVGHQIWDKTSPMTTWTAKLAHGVLVWSTPGLIFGASRVLEGASCKKLLLIVGYLGFFFVGIGVALLPDEASFMVAGLILVLPNVVLMLVKTNAVITFLRTSRQRAAGEEEGESVRSTGAFLLAASLMVAGVVIQASLAPVCGHGAYEDCFADCPFPDYRFAHNAVYHVFHAASVLLLALGAYALPAARIEVAPRADP